MKNYAPDDLVKSCPKLEAGLRFGPEGVRACQLGPFAAPVYWSAKEAATTTITKEMIVAKRRQLFDTLNDPDKDVICKKCEMMIVKPFKEVDLTRLGRVDHAPRTICNLRCDFCGFTQAEKRGDLLNAFVESEYNSLSILKVFKAEDVQWDAAVDFNGGETSLIKNLGAYLEWFNQMKISILLFSNGVIFKQEIYDGISNGSIQWAVVSIDCGTPATYLRTKKADVFGRVLETVSRYADAGSKGKGKLAIKYIFTEDNCSDDDVYGFVYAMLAIRPQKIWLTFDFTPFGVIPPDANDFQGYDFEKQIQAYAKMYRLFKQHGQDVVHYTEGHLAKISKPGKLLLQRVLDATDNMPPDTADPRLLLQDFRNGLVSGYECTRVDLQADAVIDTEQGLTFDLSHKRIALAPATEKSIALLNHPALASSSIVGFIDKSPALQGKSIEGHAVNTYEHALAYDFVLASPPSQHREEILSTLYRNKPAGSKILLVS